MRIDFDEIDTWEHGLTSALGGIVSEEVRSALRLAKIDWFEDACELLRSRVDNNSLVRTTFEWIRTNTVCAYHGTRVSESELASIRSTGLQPLDASTRANRLTRALSVHPRWPEVANNLPDALRKFGDGESAGRRQGQVHLTLSRAGLTNGFNHYLRQGSEFDKHVANCLLGSEGVALLESDGEPLIVKCELDGAKALEGAHPTSSSSVEKMIARGELPNLVREFLHSWSYRLHDPEDQPAKRTVDCGLWFRVAVPPEAIVELVPTRLSEG